MKVITIVNPKGGVGKTTTSIHIAEMAKRMGKRVLVVDLDNQGSCSTFFKVNDENTSFQLFDSFNVAQTTLQSENLNFLCASGKLLDVDKANNGIVKVFAENIKKLSDQFDVVVIDTAGFIGVRMAAALAAATHVITPISIGLFELAAFQDLIKYITSIKSSSNPNLKIRILPMKTQGRGKAEVAMIEKLSVAYKGLVLPYQLHERASVKRSVDARQCVWDKPKGISHKKVSESWINAFDGILNMVLGGGK